MLNRIAKNSTKQISVPQGQFLGEHKKARQKVSNKYCGFRQKNKPPVM